MHNKIKVFYRIKPNVFDENIINYKIINNQLNLKIHKNNENKILKVHSNCIFDKKCFQKEIFNEVLNLDKIENLNNNLLIFCFGETNSGKTYTMIGDKNWENRGIIPRYIQNLFISKLKNIEFTFSFIEIYNENIYDLFDNSKLLSKNKETYKEYNINNVKKVLELYVKGCFNRISYSTKNNIDSSRSHGIFIIKIKDFIKRKVKLIHLVDLAGSEAFDKKLKNIKKENEAKYINKSLSFFEELLINLEKKNNFINFRNSTLNNILKSCFTTPTLIISIINLNINEKNINDTINSIRFANRINNIDLYFIREKAFIEDKKKKNIKTPNKKYDISNDKFNNLKLLYEESLIENKKLKKELKNVKKESSIFKINKIEKSEYNGEFGDDIDIDENILKNKLKNYYKNDESTFKINNLEEANLLINLGKNIYKEKLNKIQNKFDYLFKNLKKYDNYYKDFINENLSVSKSFINN